MNRQHIIPEGPWAWTREAVVIDRAVGDGEGREQLWTCSYVPSPWKRTDYSLGVELSGDFSDVNALNQLLLAFWARFEQDSLLAAVVRKPSAGRVLLYTGALKPIAFDRIRALRGERRLDSTLVDVFHDHRWDKLKEFLSSVGKGAER